MRALRRTLLTTLLTAVLLAPLTVSPAQAFDNGLALTPTHGVVELE